MKKNIYRAINFLGYYIYNKKKKERKIWDRLKKYNILKHRELLYTCAVYIFKIENSYKDLDISENQNFLIVSFDSNIFEVESAEEFFILCEVFVDKEYNFRCNSPCLVFDIGANVGITSIFFSKLINVKEIYAFEPVIDTYLIAKRNFKNSRIFKIQEFYNFGLGGSNREEIFLFNKDSKGNAGIRGSLSPILGNRKDLQTRKVKIYKASDILKPIIEVNKELSVVVKIDCEGAEYEIIKNLEEENLLFKVDIFLIEWHDRGPKILEEYLIKNNFTIFSRAFDSISGIIYAKNEIKTV